MTGALACPACHAPWRQHPFCPNDGTLRATGTVIGDRYQLDSLLGAGGMGFVFAGRHKLLGRPVAVKVLRSELEADADQVGRFLREAQLCSQIHHDNIVEITDFGRDERGHLYLVMDLLIGASLSDVLSREGRMPLKRALRILRQLCRALICAHEAGVVHRDLTPRNIFLVTESGREDVVKLLDFGISRTVSGLDRITSTGIALGTTPYMPTEQLRGVAEQDQQVDIYALGVIAYELLTGELPFQARNQAELIAEKLTQEPIDLRGTDLDARAPAIARLISECLAANPRLRPAGAAEVEQRLLSSGGLQTEQTEDLEGARVGSYRLVRLLGAGGVGSVWQGEHPVIGSQVAIKILHPQMCESEEAVRRFVVEAQAVNRIDSPYIVKTFDFGKMSDGRDYAVMELLQGETLAERLVGGPLSWRHTRPVATALARALVSAHEVGIVHRDLKPENIHVGSDADDPVVKILDFGIAKLLGGDVAQTHRTKLGVCIGTPLYASPEQVSGQPIGPQADIYALGGVLFEMLTGEPPFIGTMQDLVRAKLSEPAPCLAARVADLPAAVGVLVNAMLASQPQGRPGTDEVLATLQQIPVSASSDGDPRAMIIAPGLDREAALRLSNAETRLTPPPPTPAPAPIPISSSPPSASPGASPGAIPATHHAPAADEAAPQRSPRSRAPLLLGGGIGLVVLGAVIALLLWSTQAPDGPAREPAPTRLALTKAAPEVKLARAAASEPAERPEPRPNTRRPAASRRESKKESAGAREEQLYWIRSSPSGALVALGAKVLGRTPVRVRLTPLVGSITVVLSKKGYLRTRATLRAGGPRAVRVRLRPARNKSWDDDPFTSSPSSAAKKKTSRKKTSRSQPRKGKLVNPFDE